MGKKYIKNRVKLQKQYTKKQKKIHFTEQRTKLKTAPPSHADPHAYKWSGRIKTVTILFV